MFSQLINDTINHVEPLNVPRYKVDTIDVKGSSYFSSFTMYNVDFTKVQVRDYNRNFFVSGCDLNLIVNSMYLFNNDPITCPIDMVLLQYDNEIIHPFLVLFHYGYNRVFNMPQHYLQKWLLFSCTVDFYTEGSLRSPFRPRIRSNKGTNFYYFNVFDQKDCFYYDRGLISHDNTVSLFLDHKKRTMLVEALCMTYKDELEGRVVHFVNDSLGIGYDVACKLGWTNKVFCTSNYGDDLETLIDSYLSAEEKELVDIEIDVSGEVRIGGNGPYLNVVEHSLGVSRLVVSTGIQLKVNTLKKNILLLENKEIQNVLKNVKQLVCVAKPDLVLLNNIEDICLPERDEIETILIESDLCTLCEGQCACSTSIARGKETINLNPHRIETDIFLLDERYNITQEDIFEHDFSFMNYVHFYGSQCPPSYYKCKFCDREKELEECFICFFRTINGGKCLCCNHIIPSVTYTNNDILDILRGSDQEMLVSVHRQRQSYTYMKNECVFLPPPEPPDDGSQQDWYYSKVVERLRITSVLRSRSDIYGLLELEGETCDPESFLDWLIDWGFVFEEG